MRPRIAFEIYRKEIRDSLRDRRTLMIMVGLPILMYPLLIIGMSSFRSSQEKQGENRPSEVAVWGNVPADLRALLTANKIDLRPWLGASPEIRRRVVGAEYQPIIVQPEWKENSEEKKPAVDPPLVVDARPLILARKADAVLVLWPDFADSLQKDGFGHVEVLYDSVRENSSRAGDRLRVQLAHYRDDLRAKREATHGFTPGFTRVFDSVMQNVATGDRQAGFGIGQILPLILIAVCFTGAFYAAIDQTAGEKERGTLQTLLCAPIRSEEIIAGKFMAVWTIALITAVINVASMGATFARITAQSSRSLSISPSHYALTLLMLIPLTFTAVALFLAVAAMAKSFKDGQNYLTPMLMVLMVPSAVSSMPGIELNAWTAFIPVVNTSLLIKALMVGEASADMVFLVLVGSCLVAVLAIVFAARIFSNETILLGGKDSWRGVLGVDGRRLPHPTPSISFTVFGVVLVLVFYGSLILMDKGMIPSLLTIEYGFMLLPALVVAAIFKFPLKATFSIRPLSWQSLAAGVITGMCGWIAAMGLALRLVPPPEEFSKALQKLLMMDAEQIPFWLLLLLIGITPAICEELLFRGLLLSGLRPLGQWPAILISAFLFGLAHASIYRLLPTFLLGVVFGYLVWRSGSIFTSMIAHALNNCLLTTLTKYPHLLRFAGVRPDVNVSWAWTIAGIIIILSALWLVSASRPRQSQAIA